MDPYQDLPDRRQDVAGYPDRGRPERPARDRRYDDRRYDDRGYGDRGYDRHPDERRNGRPDQPPARNGRPAYDDRGQPRYDDRRPPPDDRRYQGEPRDDRRRGGPPRDEDRTRVYPGRAPRPHDPPRDHGHDPRGDGRRPASSVRPSRSHAHPEAASAPPRTRDGRDSSGDMAPDARFESPHRDRYDGRSPAPRDPQQAAGRPAEAGTVYGGQRANRSDPPSERRSSEHDGDVFAWQDEASDDPAGFFVDEEEDDSRLARHRRRKQQGRDRRRSLLALGGVVLLVVALGGIGYFGFENVTGWFATPDYTGNGSGEVTVEIAEGQSTTAIGKTLTEAGVVKSPKAFVEAAEDDPEALTLRPGTYQLRKQMKGTAALALLLDPKSRISQGITLPEGLNLAEQLEIIAKATGIPIADLQKAAKDVGSLGLPAWAKPLPPQSGTPAAKLQPEAALEGFLFPDTYEFSKNSNATELLRTMVNQSVQAMESIDFVKKAEAVNLTPYEALVVASVLEEEGIAKDFSKIARVIYNREEAGMQWGMDSTVNYVNKTKTLNPSAAQLNVESAYNTRKYRGFPPTPISAPGKAALTAAVEPAAGPWLYFVKFDKAGNSAFATTLGEHEGNIAQARKNGAF